MRIITPPAVEPVTLIEVKAQLGIQGVDTQTDAILTRRITEARLWAENYTNRAVITQTREIRWDCFLPELATPSALTILTVKYIDTAGTLQTVTASDYELDNYSESAFVRPTYGVYWPVTRIERNAVRVQFTAGYGTSGATVEPLIREAIMLLVGHWTNFQPQSENGLIISHVPRAIERMLDPFVIIKYA